MVFGLSETGFLPKDLETIKTELEDEWRQRFGQNVEVDPQSPDGQIIGLMADREADIWDQVERVYSAAYLDGASAASLDDLVAQADASRDPATFSVVTLTLGGTPGTPIPAGSTVEDSSSGRIWATLEAVVIGGGGTVQVDANPESEGPVPALAGTIDTIDSPITGWTSVTNAEDADLGADVETDASLRTKYRTTFRGGGGSSDEAIRASILKLEGVTQCIVISNRTSAEVDGQPPKSIHVVVQGGQDTEIIGRLWEVAPGGIEFFGSVSGVVTDDNGDPQTVKFSRFSIVPVHVLIEYATEETASEDIESLILAEVLDKAMSQLGGVDVVPFQYKQAIETSGLLDLLFYVGLSTSPSTEDVLVISKTQIAELDSSRILFSKVN